MSETALATEQRPASRNALNRITSAFGFAQKPRWIQDFRIELDQKNPKHRFNPGDVIRGTIFFTPTKAVKITHITISLYGYVHVFKTFNAPGEFVPKDSLNSDPNKMLSVPGIVPLFNPVEEILFGDVKLQPCRGQFQFGLRLPSHRLPSSIDFERGSIQYNLVATITRPGHINPVIRSDPKKFLVDEVIDCCKFSKPKQRVVTLEVVEKKKRGKKTPSLTISSEKFGAISSVTEHDPPSPRSSLSPSTDGSHHDDAASVSNSSSSTELRITNITSHSASNTVSLAGGSQSGSNGSNAGSHDGSQEFGSPGSNQLSHGTSRQSTSQKSSTKTGTKAVTPSRTVSASVELLRGAFLPGDSIPVHVQVSHIKHVKSMCGLIVTLYRKTHIETEPLIHQKVKDENGNITLQPVTGDIYPKSLTGFGGLSMSNKQTSHTFRMDVAQTHVPLFVDPVTHKADIKLRLDIPDEGVHPTITHVRGDTLDFRYYLEICLDVQGKLEESRFLPRLTNQAIHGLGKPSARKSPSVPMSLAAQGQQLIDTQAIRRENKQIVVWTFDLVIGTRDSSRGNKSHSKPATKRQVDPWPETDLSMQPQSSTHGSEYSRRSRLDDVQEDTAGEEARTPGSRGTDSVSNGTRKQSPLQRANHSPRARENWSQRSMSHEELSRTQFYSSGPPLAPPSVMPAEPVDEKTRLKQQEQRLLPSHPDVDNAGTSGPSLVPPSAPPAEGHDVYDNHQWGMSTERHDQQSDSGYGSSRLSSDSRLRALRSRTHEDTVPSYETVSTNRPTSAGLHGSRAGASSSAYVPGIITTGLFSQFDFSQGSPSRPQPQSQTQSVTDDKQELERHRLLSQRSAPNYNDGSHPEDPEAAVEPSVPGASDETGNDDAFGEWHTNQEGLPKYENLDR